MTFSNYKLAILQGKIILPKKVMSGNPFITQLFPPLPKNDV